MADQRSSFRFRFPWAPAAPAPRATAQRARAQPATSTTPAPAPRRATETQVPSQPTSTRSPTTGQSTGSAIPAQVSQKTAEAQVPSQPTSTTTRTLTPQSVETETPTQPNTDTVTPQIQSTTTRIPSSETPQNAKTEAPSPSIDTKTPIQENTQTVETQPPSQSAYPTTPTTLANTQAAQTQSTSQPAATATISTSESQQFRPPDATSQQAPLPQPQASRIESQPSSPSRMTSQSRVPSQAASPSRATTQSRSLQPSSPSRAASQSRATSLLSSPSRKGSPNSPTSRTTSQRRSQPRTASRTAGQTISTSPSSKAAQVQPTTSTLSESTSTSNSEPGLNSKTFLPSSTSADVPSTVLEKEPTSSISDQQSLQLLQPKEETKSGMIYDSQKQTPVETSTEPNQTALQPLEESGMRTTTTLTPTEGPQTSVPTKKTDPPTRSSEPESFPKDSKPEETKEVKEIMQETKVKTYNEDIDKDHYLLTKGPPSAVQTKEQLSFTYQSEQAQQAVEQKEVMRTPTSNGKETNTTAQTRNKTVSVESHQKLAMNNGGHIPLHKEVRDDISKLVQKIGAGDPKKSVHDRPVSVITLAGENRGATMHLGTDSMNKGGAVPIHRAYKLNPDENAETTTDGEGSFKVKSEDSKDTEEQAAEAFVNSNVQGINNSIMFNGSITERSPGVHLVHSRYPVKLRKSTAEQKFLDREKTEFSTTHAQRLTYEPMVRRRCLQGLFLESSDSEPENNTKPRRHGCRVGCKERSKENKNDVV